MQKENYYLAYYQAILDKNLTKLVKLVNLTNEEQLNYPEEYPHLNYNEIFKTNNPMDFFYSLLSAAEFKDFYLNLIDAINPLATAENIATREKSFIELMKYPLIDYCPNDSAMVIESLLSVIYSKAFSKNEVVSQFKEIIKQSPIIDDVLSVISVSIKANPNKPFSIALIDEKIASFDPTYPNNVGYIMGYYNSISNKLVVTNENNKLNLEFIIHELTHKAMNEIFKNNCKPYNNEFLKDKYHSAIKNTFINIQAFIKNNFGLSKIFDDANDIYHMGKILSSIFFPQYLSGNAIEEFISIFKRNNLNINDQFLWLNGNSPLELALHNKNFELANLLVKTGELKLVSVHGPVIYNNSEVMNWFLKNKLINDISYKDCEGNTALDYAKNPIIIKTLISAGAASYPVNFAPFCSIAPECNDTKVKRAGEGTIIIKEQLKTLQMLLDLYVQNSSPYEQDLELIVRLPQIIASGLYKGEIIDVLEPLAMYWQDYISPAVTCYQELYANSDTCLAPLEYPDFFSSYL